MNLGWTPGGIVGMASGGSFQVEGPPGNDNLWLPHLRVQRGEMVEVKRGDGQDGVAREVMALRAQVARLEAALGAVVAAINGQTDTLVEESGQTRKALARAASPAANRVYDPKAA